MHQSLITTLTLGVCLPPVLVFIFFAFLLFRKTEDIKVTENTVAFLAALAFLLFAPVFFYFTDILSRRMGFLGYYFSLPGVFSSLFATDKKACLFFIFYLLSIHALFAVPFIAVARLFIMKRNVLRLVYEADIDSQGPAGIAAGKIEVLAREVQSHRGIKGEVLVRVVEQRSKRNVIGSTSFAVVKSRDRIILIVSRRFLEFVMSGLINEDDIKAIIHHEFSHIANRDYLIPIASTTVFNRMLSLFIVSAFCLYFIANLRYRFFNEPGIIRQEGFQLYPLPIIAAPLAISFCLLFGEYLIAISFFMRRCEALADQLTLKFIEKKALIDAIVKTSVLSESGVLPVLSFFSVPESSKRKRTLLEDIVYALRSMNIFSDYNKTFFHPSISDRISLLNNPRAIIEEKESGFMKLEIFIFVSFFLIVLCDFFLVLSRWVVQGTNAYDASLAIYTNFLYFFFVFFACIPMRYLETPVAINIKTVRLLAAYSLFVTCFSNLLPSMNLANFIMRDYGSAPAWYASALIASQISKIISNLIGGFIFSMFLFLIFVSVGNFFIRMRSRRSQKREIAA